MSDFVMTIAGEPAPTEATFGVKNPATGEVFAEAPECSRQQLDAAFDAAAKAGRDWKADEAQRRAVLTPPPRSSWPGRRARTSAHGRAGQAPSDAGVEVIGSGVWCQYYANLEIAAQVIQDDEAAYVELARRPLGVVAAITPWNFPLLLSFWKIAPALLAGNTLVLKPSPYTPLSTLKMGELLRDVFPPGVVNIVSGSDELGAWMTSHPVPRKISFTGSVETGKKVAMAAAPDLKRVTLELGGNDPAIVLDDADPATVAAAIFAGAFMNNGQVCSAVKRVVCPRGALRRRGRGLAAAARHQGRRGERGGREARADQQRAAVREGQGARGRRHLPRGDRCHRRQGHGPPRLLLRADDPRRALRRHAYRGRGAVRPRAAGRRLSRPGRRHRPGQRDALRLVGLGVGRRHRRAAEVAAQLECGTAWVNTHLALAPSQPFGGFKWSGIGVENGPWGLAGFTEFQVVHRPKAVNGLNANTAMLLGLSAHHDLRHTRTQGHPRASPARHRERDPVPGGDDPPRRRVVVSEDRSARRGRDPAPRRPPWRRRPGRGAGSAQSAPRPDVPS